jgi:DNA polymerase-3 subunit gamma/tau
MAAANATVLRTLEDVVALAVENRASVLKVHLENDVHLVRLEPGIIEFRPGPRAPNTLAGDLKQKLKEWTGASWTVGIAREGGAPTIAEQRKSAKAARMESVMQVPLVRAVLDRFPGSEIVAVRDASVPDVAAPALEDDADA